MTIGTTMLHATLHQCIWHWSWQLKGEFAKDDEWWLRLVNDATKRQIWFKNRECTLSIVRIVCGLTWNFQNSLWLHFLTGWYHVQEPPRKLVTLSDQSDHCDHCSDCQFHFLFPLSAAMTIFSKLWQSQAATQRHLFATIVCENSRLHFWCSV